MDARSWLGLQSGRGNTVGGARNHGRAQRRRDRTSAPDMRHLLLPNGSLSGGFRFCSKLQQVCLGSNTAVRGRNKGHGCSKPQQVCLGSNTAVRSRNKCVWVQTRLFEAATSVFGFKHGCSKPQ
eukprot:343648-Chlamydomonas_euryale.AAC.3